MAIYLTHNYGTRFYGPEPDLPNFNPDSFIAYSRDYRTVHITWDPPTGEFTRFRLLKNRWGYPVSEIDGEILLDSETPENSYNDIYVAPGHFVYYSAFLQLGGQWMWAATASCLHIADMKSAAWLWSRLPIHYQIMRGNRLDLEADTNSTLMRYLGLIGWGLDKVRTSFAAAWRSQDPAFAHIGSIDLLIQQFGLPAYPGLSGARKRAFVRDAASLLARRGTMDAMIAEARAASGWDLALRPSPNLMLTADRSQMLNPRPREWDPTIIYKVGDRVELEGAHFVCKVAGATGYAQMPPAGERVSNTWWDPLLVLDAATAAYDPTSRSQHGWAPQAFSVTTDDKIATELVLGAPKPLETHLSINAVTVKNNHTAAANIGARCLPEAAGQPVKPLTAITHGIPIPKPQPWDATTEYPAGSLVTFQGRLYTAVRPGRLGVAPRISDRWQVVGTDTRVRLTLSAYTHQPHTATSKPVNPAQVYAEFYDERGAFLGREFGAATDTRVLDTFTTHHVTDTTMVVCDRFPVTAGTAYTGTAWLYQPSSSLYLELFINWLTSAGGYISSTIVGITPALATWTQVTTGSVNAPAGAAQAEMVIIYKGGAVQTQPLYVDEIQLATTAAPTVPINPNSTFSSGVGNWHMTYGGTLALSSTIGHASAPSMKITPTGISALSRLSGRTTEYGSKVWSVGDGMLGFQRDSYLYGVVRPTDPAARSFALLDYGSGNATVAATFSTNAPTGMVQALILRAASTTSYIRATRTKVQTVNGAAITDLVTYSTPVKDGDRLTVKASGTSITVLRNGVQVATATSTFNQANTKFGIAVEA
ncbi:hypothetical protein [Nonomuraea sp. SYSU D8015]|uniref:hypothetical protein n=1 Tax=Nonomuraea sp. SYSU D8015 TaxID=2593644 RepID=UPI0016612E1A|nr:hypothetical protein [Nonomuraea sp. SYSU D8015]